jgi:hypothetical protein
VLLTLQGRPGKLTSSDLALFQHSMIQAYNMVVNCGSSNSSYLVAANAFIRLEQVNITSNTVHIISSSSTTTTSLNFTQDFTLVAATTGDCRGCKTNNTSSLSFQLLSGVTTTTTSRQRHRGLLQRTRRTLQQASGSLSKQSLAGSDGGAASLNKAVTAPVTKKNPLPVICTCSVPTKSLFLHTMNTLVPLPTSIDKVLDISNYKPNATTTTTTTTNSTSNATTTNSTFNACPGVINFTTYLTLDFAAGSEDTFDATNLPLQYQLLQQAVVNAYNVAKGLNASGMVCDPQFTVLVNATVIVTPDSGYGVTGLNRRRRRRHLTNSYTTTGTALTFVVQGKCRGCSNNVSLFSDPVTTGITADEYQLALNDQLAPLIASGSITIVGDAEDSLQVVPVTCAAQVNLFHAVASVSYAGNASDLSSDQLDLLGQLFQSTYNTLAQDRCDPLFRTINSVQYVGVAPSTNSSSRRHLKSSSSGSGNERSYIILVDGRCRGCSSSTALFNDASGRRRLRPSFQPELAPESSEGDTISHHVWQEPQEERALQQNATDQCYC